MQQTSIRRWRAPGSVALIGLLALLALGAGEARAHDPSIGAWRLSAETLRARLAAEPAGALSALLKGLAEPDGAGAPLSEAEFLGLFERAEARRAPAAPLILIASPASVAKQNQSHEDMRAVFLAQERLAAGQRFLAEHRELLAAAEARYGVARWDIVAILMWESGLGEFTGRHRVFGVLLGQILFLEQARDHALRDLQAAGSHGELRKGSPTAVERERFERLRARAARNLVALLRECKAGGVDPLSLRGSWAGAIGYPQFMPSSLGLAVDGDGDGRIDLSGWPDAIFSVANYLRERGDYGPERAERRRAVGRYNPQDSYVDGVIAYADSIASPTVAP